MNRLVNKNPTYLSGECLSISVNLLDGHVTHNRALVALQGCLKHTFQINLVSIRIGKTGIKKTAVKGF